MQKDGSANGNRTSAKGPYHARWAILGLGRGGPVGSLARFKIWQQGIEASEPAPPASPTNSYQYRVVGVFAPGAMSHVFSAACDATELRITRVKNASHAVPADMPAYISVGRRLEFGTKYDSIMRQRPRDKRDRLTRSFRARHSALLAHYW